MITDPRRLPDEAKPLLEEFRNLGFGSWSFDTAGRMPDVTRRVQVRNIDKLAPPVEVSRYALAYERGDKLPPVVVTRDGFLVDGATRVMGALKAKKSSISQFTIGADWEGGAEMVKKRFIGLGTALNMRHGRKMDDANIMDLILLVAQEGEAARTLAARLHCSESTVNGALAQKRAIDRAIRLNVAPEGLKGSHLKSLGGKTQLTDPVWTALVELTRDAGLTVTELGEIAREVTERSTQDAKLEAIAAERKSRADQIRGISRRPTRAGVVRRGLGALLQAELEPATAVELDPQAAERYIDFLRRSRRTIDDILAEQARVESSRGVPGGTVPFKSGR